MIFVTGGSGFIGTHLLRQLISEDKEVRALKRKNSKIFLEDEVSRKIEWMEGDILDIPSLETAMEGCDEVYHCAAKVSFKKKDAAEIMQVNAGGTANVVNVALEKTIRKMVYASSVAAIGTEENEMISEETAWENNGHHSNYAISKFLAEREVWRGIAEGLNAVIINPTLVIGDGNWLEGPPRFFLNAWKGMKAYTNGTNGFVAVKDVINIMLLLMDGEISNERFIINGENISYKDFFFLIADKLGKKRPFLNVFPWLTEFIWRIESVRSALIPFPPAISKETARIAQSKFYFDNSKIKNALHYKFTPMEQCADEVSKKFLEEISSGRFQY